MKSAELERQRQRFVWLLSKAEIFTSGELEIHSHWARYLCVLAAGFLENALSEVYSQYARQSASPYVAGYVERVLGRIQNPKASRFIETAGAFNGDWVEDLETFLDEGGRREAIDSIMANRNQIVHGKDSGITVVRVKTYFDKGVEVIEFLEVQCGIT